MTYFLYVSSTPCRQCLENACKTYRKAGTVNNQTIICPFVRLDPPLTSPSRGIVRHYTVMQKLTRTPVLLNKQTSLSASQITTRNFGVARLVGRFLKIRYLLFTSAVGGGVTAHQVIISTLMLPLPYRCFFKKIADQIYSKLLKYFVVDA